jgi:hypothetical protein
VCRTCVERVSNVRLTCVGRVSNVYVCLCVCVCVCMCVQGVWCKYWKYCELPGLVEGTGVHTLDTR